MRILPAPFRYALLTSRLDQLWLPAALWALFAFVAWLENDTAGKGAQIAVAFLGTALPLIAGILAAYTTLDDPALELHFSSPQPARRVFVERLAIILGIVATTALSFEGFLAVAGVDMAGSGSFGVRVLGWLVPSVALIGLGSSAAFAVAGTTPAAMLVGGIWFVQVIARSWFAGDPIARYFLLFMGAMYPDHPARLANQAILLGLAGLFLWAGRALLRKQERYL